MTTVSRPLSDQVLATRVVAAAADAIFCQDADGVVLSWNPAAERLYGYPAADMVGARSDALLPAAEREHLQSLYDDALAGRLVDRLDTAHVRRDGALVAVSVTMAPLRDDAGAVVGVATTVADVSERVHLATALDEARAELQRRHLDLVRSNRDLEQFAYVASHDLSEPLRVMRGYVEQLDRRYGDGLDDRAHRYMRHIVDASTRMRALIDDLLEYSRFLRTERDPVVVELTDVVGCVLVSLAPRIAESHADVQVQPALLPPVLSDRAQLESLLQNLLGNALKFAVPGRAPHVRLSAEQEGEWVTLTVDDDGIGIAEEYRERVFRMFQRLHVREAYSGTGIGLAIAQQIVELHGGRIWVEDSPLGGARFCCTLPAAHPGSTA